MSYLTIRKEISSFGLILELEGKALEYVNTMYDYDILDDFIQDMGDYFEGKYPSIEEVGAYILSNANVYIILNRPIYTFEDKAEIEVFLIKSHIPYSEEKLANIDVDNYSNIDELKEDILPW